MKKYWRGFVLLLATYSIFCLENQKKFKFDISLTQEWTKRSRYPQDPPYLYEASKNNTTLKYLAVRHTSDLTSKTYQMIKEQIETFKPEILIVEGIKSSTKKEAKDLFKEAKNCLPKKPSQNYRCGESRYAIYLAGKANIFFRGGEPSRRAVNSKLRNTKFKDKDITYFYVARSLYGRKRAEQLSEENLKQKFWEQLNRFQLTKKTNLTFQDFKLWYQEKLGREFSVSNLKNDDYAPYRKGHFLNKISFSIDIVREKNILLAIEKALNEFDKVLVIYGASHLSKHKKVLDKAFTNELNSINVKSPE